jgi:hypothetical protein
VKYLIGLAFLALAACKTAPIPEPVIQTVEVRVPVSSPCVPSKYDRTRPEYVDTEAALRAAVDAAERYQLLWGGRMQRIAREGENEAVISGCASE